MGIRIDKIVSIIALGSLLICLTPSLALARRLPSGCSQIVPESWKPSLDEVAQAIEESSKEDNQASQQALNRASQNLADIRDAQLFIAYIQLMKTLDERGQTNLFDEQKRWLNQRGEKAQASVVSKGGSLASLEYSDTFRQITEKRLAELKARLQKRAKSK